MLTAYSELFKFHGLCICMNSCYLIFSSCYENTLCGKKNFDTSIVIDMKTPLLAKVNFTDFVKVSLYGQVRLMKILELFRMSYKYMGVIKRLWEIYRECGAWRSIIPGVWHKRQGPEMHIVCTIVYNCYTHNNEK